VGASDVVGVWDQWRTSGLGKSDWVLTVRVHISLGTLCRHCQALKCSTESICSDREASMLPELSVV